jgi:ADP-ribose pyrophosphatase YjhB (NUDIX family)
MTIDWSMFKKGVFLVNCLAIIVKDGKILIGRRVPDKYIKELTWSFPGGRPSYYKPLESSLKAEVYKKTGLRIKVKKLIFARNYPEMPEFLSLYYLAEPVGGQERPGEKFMEIKWIKPTEVKDFFTTSIDPHILKFLKMLERGCGTIRPVV